MALSVVPPEHRRFVFDDFTQQVARTRLSVDDLLSFYGIKKSTYYGWFDEDGSFKEAKDYLATVEANRLLKKAN